MALDLSRFDDARWVIVHRPGCPVYSSGVRRVVIEPFVTVTEGWKVVGCGWCEPRFGVVVSDVHRVRGRSIPDHFLRDDRPRRHQAWPPYGAVAVDMPSLARARGTPDGHVRDWKQRANCRSTDVRLGGWLRWLWTANHQHRWPITVMKVMCGECPVRGECLEAGVWGDEPWGVWGGATVEERAKLRRKWTLEGREGDARPTGSRVAASY